MENQKQPQVMAAGKAKNGRRKKLLIILFAIIAVGCGIIWFLNTDWSNSRASTPAEIAAQEEFQRKLTTSQEEYQQKIDVARKEAEQTGTHPKWSEVTTDSAKIK